MLFKNNTKVISSCNDGTSRKGIIVNFNGTPKIVCGNIIFDLGLFKETIKA